jgi:hypothetical protein
MFPTQIFPPCLPKTARRGASKSRAVIEQISVEVNTDVRLQAVWESLYKINGISFFLTVYEFFFNGICFFNCIDFF